MKFRQCGNGSSDVAIGKIRARVAINTGGDPAAALQTMLRNAERKGIDAKRREKMKAAFESVAGVTPTVKTRASPRALTDQEIANIKPVKTKIKTPYRFAPDGMEESDYEIYNGQVAIKDRRDTDDKGKKKSSTFHGNYEVMLMIDGEPYSLTSMVGRGNSSRQSQLGIFASKKAAQNAAKAFLRNGIDGEYIAGIKSKEEATKQVSKMREIFTEHEDAYGGKINPR